MFTFEAVLYEDIINIPELFIREGIITTLVGQSGSGKSTILKLLNKMISPTSGHIFYQDKSIADIPSVEHRRNIVTLSQNPVIFNGSIRENLLAGFRFQQREFPEEHKLAEIMERVQLRKELDTNASELSGGEKQRLALGRVLLLDTQVCLFDELSSSLDAETEHLVIDTMIAEARKRNKTIVMVTHSKPIAEEYSDEIIEVKGGRTTKRK